MTQQIATIGTSGNGLTTQLMEILQMDDLMPGSEPSYNDCKTLYLWHPLGAKIVEMPVKMAQSQQRIITIEGAPEQEVREQFLDTRKRLRCDYYIRGAAFTARIYGVGALLCSAIEDKPMHTLDLEKIADQEIYFNVLDPLNTAGSIVLNQDPTSPMFQKHGDVSAGGTYYHRSKTCVLYNEQPVYLSFTSSAFGFSGRSVYQRALYPLKSFIQTMITDDMVSMKAGLLVAFLKQASSLINKVMEGASAIKRAFLQMAGTGNVLSVDKDERIESIDLQNIDKAMITARSNIIKNIATAVPMPAQILEQESFAEGFGEGTEDTKNIVRFVNEVREEIQPLYDFTDRIAMHKAWTPEFIETIKAKYPGRYDGMDWKAIFYEWKNAFRAEWPSLLEEPESEQSKMEKVKLEGLVSVYEILSSTADPENKARLAAWVVDNVNEYKKLFRIGLDIDVDELIAYAQQQAENQQQMHENSMEEDPPLKLARSK